MTVGVEKENGAADAMTTGYRKPEYDEKYVDLIHETLIRARPVDKGSKLVGYWQTLYDYIDKNRDRLFYRDQLKQQAATWQSSRWFGRWWHLAGWRDLKHLSRVRPGRATLEGRFLRWSVRLAWLQACLLALLLAWVGEACLWTLNNAMPPPSYMLMQQRFRLMNLGWLGVAWRFLARLNRLVAFLRAPRGRFFWAAQVTMKLLAQKLVAECNQLISLVTSDPVSA